MRFGSHTHVDPKQIDTKLRDERGRLVATLRQLADRLEAVPVDSEALAWMAATVEPLVRTVERAFEREK